LKCGAADAAMILELRNFDKGLVFIKDTDIIIGEK
jgi:hypothetical protein